MKAEFAVADFQVRVTGTLPRWLRRQLCRTLDEKPEAVLVRES